MGVASQNSIRFRLRQQLSQSRCLSLLLAMSGRVFLFVPPRGREPPPTLSARLNPHLSLQRHHFPIPRYAKRPDLALYASVHSFSYPPPLIGLPSLRFYAVGSSLFLLSVCFCLCSLFYRDDVLCWLLLARPFLYAFHAHLRFPVDLVWFRLSCDHGWIRSGSVNVRKQQQQQQQQPSKHDSLWQPPGVHSDERPRPQKYSRAQATLSQCSHTLTHGYLNATVHTYDYITLYSTLPVLSPQTCVHN